MSPICFVVVLSFFFIGTVSTIIFPDENQVAFDNCLKVDGPFCVNTTAYPTDAIQRALRKNQKFFEKFFNSKEDFLPYPSPTDTASRNSGPDDDVEEVQMCSSSTRIIFPKYGVTTNNEKYTIVNTDTHKQGVQISKCDDDGKSCDPLISLPLSYIRTVCKQKKTEIKLLGAKHSANSNDLELLTTPFEIPSCCECVIVKKKHGF